MLNSSCAEIVRRLSRSGYSAQAWNRGEQARVAGGLAASNALLLIPPSLVRSAL